MCPGISSRCTDRALFCTKPVADRLKQRAGQTGCSREQHFFQRLGQFAPLVGGQLLEIALFP
jgi:hypothetical protein